MRQRLLFLLAFVISCATSAVAQELQARITINHNQIQGTDASVFENLQHTLEQFVNERQWTNLHFQKNERIQCNFNITVLKYDQGSNLFTCRALSRPTVRYTTPHTPQRCITIPTRISTSSSRSSTNWSSTMRPSTTS